MFRAQSVCAFSGTEFLLSGSYWAARGGLRAEVFLSRRSSEEWSLPSHFMPMPSLSPHSVEVDVEGVRQLVFQFFFFFFCDSNARSGWISDQHYVGRWFVRGRGFVLSRRAWDDYRYPGRQHSLLYGCSSRNVNIHLKFTTRSCTSCVSEIR